MRVFFDTEFTELGVNPKLISIGFVDETGERTFYAELSDTYKEKDCSDFVREVVLPLLEGGKARMTRHVLGKRLAVWLEAFGEPVRMVTDSQAWDWPWIHEIFIERAWPVNLDSHALSLATNDLVNFDRFESAVEKAFTNGLRRHHALYDAKANRLGWIATSRDYDWETNDST